MQGIKFLLGIFLIGLVANQEVDCEEVEDSIQRRAYLDLPDLSELHSESSPDEDLQQVVKEVVAKVDMSSEPDEVASKIGELVAEQRRGLGGGGDGGDEQLDDSWKIMEELSDYKSSSCSSELVFATRHFLAGLDDEQTYAKLHPFLKRIWPDLYPRCAREITKGQLNYDSFPMEASNQFRTLLRDATGGKGTGPWFTAIVQRIRLPDTAADLSLPAMLSVIVRKFGMPKKRVDFTKEIEKVWDKYCADIHAGDFYDNFEIINLANAFEPAFELNNLHAQLSEFHRICSDWRRDEVHEKTLEVWREKERGGLKLETDASDEVEVEGFQQQPWWQFW